MHFNIRILEKNPQHGRADVSVSAHPRHIVQVLFCSKQANDTGELHDSKSKQLELNRTNRARKATSTSCTLYRQLTRNVKHHTTADTNKGGDTV